MRIIHTSDIHLDSPLTSRLPADKSRERRKELLSGFGRLVEEAIALRAEALIIAGDLFDSDQVSGKALDTALDIIEINHSITFFYLQGNHEGDALLSCGRALPKNLKTFGDDWTYYNLNGVTIAGRNRICEGMFESLALSKDDKNIVVLHGELRDKSSAPESIGLSEAAERNIDYLALGHYHSHSTAGIDHRGCAVYSGTPEGRGFDEVGEKGYVILETDGSKVKFSFREFAKRRLHLIEVDITGATRSAEINQRAEKALKSIPSCDMVRLQLCGKYTPELWRDTDSLMRDFSGKFYYFEIKDSSRMAINPADYKHDKSLKGEFIRTVTADESLDEETKEKIICCGINALMGEELFD